MPFRFLVFAKKKKTTTKKKTKKKRGKERARQKRLWKKRGASSSAGRFSCRALFVREALVFASAPGKMETLELENHHHFCVTKIQKKSHIKVI